MFTQPEKAALAAPKYWWAVAYRGRLERDIVRGETLQVVLAAAPALYQDRPVAIYALGRNGYGAMAGTWAP